MRRVSINSLGQSDPADVAALFGGALAATFVGGEAKIFIENVTSIRRSSGRSVGRRLLEDSSVGYADVSAGSDPEAQAVISVLINSDMVVSSAFLYVNTTNQIPGTATRIDITSGISGSELNWTYSVGPNALRYYWVELVDNNSNSSISPLGPYTTADNTAPTIDSATMALGTPPTTSVELAFEASDNDSVQTVYVWLSPTQATAPTAADIKASGTALPAGSTSLTETSLSPSTTYYAWIMAKDRVGNESDVQAFVPASITTNADTVAPTVDFSEITAGEDPESQVNISLIISDAA